jgi:hypothetical protein
MRHCLAAVVALGGVAGLAWSQDKLVRPHGPPPQFAIIRKAEDDVVTLAVTRTKYVPGKVERQVERNGKVETVTETEMRPVFEWTVVRFSPAAGGRIYDTKGKRVSAAKARDRLVVGRPVLLSADGKKVDARYLRLVNADTLILVISGDAAPTSPAP